MKKRRILSTLLAAVTGISIALFQGITAFADNTATFNFPEGAQVGSSVDVTLNISCDSDIGVASANISYDETILEFVSCDYASGGGGELVIAGAFPDSPSKTLPISISFKAIDEGDASLSASGYVFDAGGTVIGEISVTDSVTVGGGSAENPPETGDESSEAVPDDESSAAEPETVTTTTTTEAVTETPEVIVTEDETSQDAEISSSAKKAESSSVASLEKERSDLAKKLTIPLLIILAVLILALVIITAWLRNRMKKKK